MWRRGFLVIAVIALGAGVYWYGFRGGHHFANLPPTATGPWIAFGDSLTQGYGSSAENDYPTLLSKQLGVHIENHGLSGHTTRDALQQLPKVLELSPRVVLLCFGGNDGLQKLPRSATFQNLAIMIDQFHARGTFVVLIGVHSASLRDTNKKSFRKLAKEKQVLFVPDILDGVLGKPSLMSDYIHPNDEGYKVIADRLEKSLRPFLPQLR